MSVVGLDLAEADSDAARHRAGLGQGRLRPGYRARLDTRGHEDSDLAPADAAVARGKVSDIAATP